MSLNIFSILIINCKSNCASGITQTDTVVTFRKFCQNSNTVSYGAINKTDGNLKIKLNMTTVKAFIVTPWNYKKFSKFS